MTQKENIIIRSNKPDEKEYGEIVHRIFRVNKKKKCLLSGMSKDLKRNQKKSPKKKCMYGKLGKRWDQ